jgi:hypothetical protein
MASRMVKAVRQATFARIALFGAVLAGIILALVLASSPHLHALVHPDAGDPEHSCLVTTIHSKGCEAAPGGPQVFAFRAALFATIPPREAHDVEALFLSCRVLEHAPPFVS